MIRLKFNDKTHRSSFRLHPGLESAIMAEPHRA